ncbi:hypothetical protein K8R32_02440 [bacterium]|nr:hypothetical protein [bacterium]
MLGERQFGSKKRKIKKRGKLHYSTKEYDNPFFTDKKKRSTIRTIDFSLSIKTKVILLFAFFIVVSTAWLLFYSRFFEIKTILINGGGRISTSSVDKIARQQINDNMLILFPQKNIFLFSKDRLSKNLEHKFVFDNIEIKKDIPDTIIVNYQEKTYDIIWQEDDIYYYADEEGSIITEVNLLEVTEKEYPLIKNASKYKIQENKITVVMTYVQFAKQLAKEFNDYKSDFKVERIIIDNEIKSVKVKIENGPFIYFNIEHDLETQIRKVLVIKREKLKDDFNAKVYIDVRIGNSVYYR